ncbi:MAG: DUF3127 domain-containing protein [Dysgonamonadaceae bacterium]|jgi:hypothetical protein|nr:DUF3127 domain-containing protein [Dysgonamonadaceae bacterium]
MQLTAKLLQILPAETGMGKNGEWKRQSIVVETDGQYSKKVCITVWGDKINTAQWQPGLPLIIDFDLESREFNGRWYTDVKAWKIEPAGIPQPQPQPAAPAPPADYDLPEPPPAAPGPNVDDLPF